MQDFSYQLYSSRNHGPLPDTLQMLATAGYTQVEGLPAMFDSDTKTAKLKELLEQNKLAMPTAHCLLPTMEQDAQALIRAAQTLGIKRYYCAYIVPEARPAEPEGWTRFGQRLTAAGAALREAGLGLGWHNHDFEFATLADGSYAIDRIFAATPQLEWEIDVAWIIKGGQDPLRWIEKYGARITTVHVKDIAPPGQCGDEDGWADPGAGTVDWTATLATLAEHTNVQYYVVEHDKPSDDNRFAANAIAYCRKAFANSGS